MLLRYRFLQNARVSYKRGEAQAYFENLHKCDVEDRPFLCYKPVNGVLHPCYKVAFSIGGGP